MFNKKRNCIVTQQLRGCQALFLRGCAKMTAQTQMGQTTTPLAAALAALGVRGSCRVVPIAMSKYRVYINNEYRGVWDNAREFLQLESGGAGA
jgi:hypothetical protein